MQTQFCARRWFMLGLSLALALGFILGVTVLLSGGPIHASADSATAMTSPRTRSGPPSVASSSPVSSNVELVGQISGAARAVAVSGTLLYRANSGYSLEIFNVANPFSPTLVGHGDMFCGSSHIVVEGDYAYLACTVAGMNIFNISNPASPYVVSTFGSIWTGPYIEAVAVQGRYAYAAFYGLYILDVSNPATPTLVSYNHDHPKLSPLDLAYGIVVSGSNAYVAQIMDQDDDGHYVGHPGLHIVDISNPMTLTTISFTPTDYEYDIDMVGNYVYVATYYGLHIFDVSNPASPTQVGYYSVPGRAARVDGGPALDVAVTADGWPPVNVAVTNDHAYFVSNYSGLHIVNVSDPASPTEVGYYDMPGGAERVAVSGDYIYAVSWDSDIWVLHYTPPPPVAAFSVTQRSGVQPLTVAFTDQSSGDVMNRLWQFGDGVTSTLSSPTHTYTVAGWYTVTLTVSGPAGSDTLTRTDYVQVYPPQPIWTAPLCGTTNQTTSVVSGVAPHGFAVTLYDNGVEVATTTPTLSNTFAFTPSLSAGPHIFTATTSSATVASPPSRPLTLTVSPTLAYDPVGVTWFYAAPGGLLTSHPRDASGCANPDGWRVWLRQWYTTTVSVPVSYTQSASITVTLGDQTRIVTSPLGSLLMPLAAVLTPPLNGGMFAITVTADGQTFTATGLALIDPDGYVYDKYAWDTQGITRTIGGISVTCEYSDTVANEWVTWLAWAYDQQVNPQETGADGYYAFFAPPGVYRVTVHHPDYQPYTSSDIVVIDQPAHVNIPLAFIWRAYLPIVIKSH